MKKMALDGDDLAAERALLLERSKDSRRQDMPLALREGFVGLYEFRREKNKSDAGPCAALAAIHGDHENWEAASEAADEAKRRGSTDTFVRALALRARRSIWDWRLDDAEEGKKLCEGDAISAFGALSTPGVDERAALQRSRRAIEAAKQRSRTTNEKQLAPSRPGGKKIQIDDTRSWIAVLTPDANAAHPLSQLLPSALQEVSLFRVALVTMCASDDSGSRRRFENAADIVVDAHEASPEAIANTIKDLDCVALVDLCCHAGSRDVLDVVVRRPAPLIIQGGLGTPALAGKPDVYDWTLCDDIVVTNSSSDRLLKMPHTYFCGDLAAYEEEEEEEKAKYEKKKRSSYGLRDSAVVLCCANRPHKVEPEIFDSWIRALEGLLRDGIDAQLWLLNPSEDARQRARTRALQKATFFSKDNIDKYLIFADKVSRGEHLYRLQFADVALDTRIYGSHTLACDYAWANVPLVTVDDPREAWHRRVATAVSRSAIFDERLHFSFEASDWEKSMETIVVNVAKNATLREDMRQALEEGKKLKAPLWDPTRWADGFERGLLSIITNEGPPVLEVPKRLPKGSAAIVLESNAARLHHYHSKIKAALPEVNKVSAVEGRHKTDELMKTLQDLGLRVSPVFSDATTGQVACAASHIREWQRIAADATLKDDDFVLILEDDAEFPRGGDAFRTIVQRVIDERKTEDLCYLYVYPYSWLDKIFDDRNLTIPGFAT